MIPKDNGNRMLTVSFDLQHENIMNNKNEILGFSDFFISPFSWAIVCFSLIPGEIYFLTIHKPKQLLIASINYKYYLL